MLSLNNKGQSLILFVLMLPVLLFVMILVIDMGNLMVEKQKLNNINYIMIDYGLSNLTKEDLEEYIYNNLKLNDEKIDKIKVSKTDNDITINLGKKESSMLGHILNLKEVEIISSYKGSIIDDKKVIERLKWSYGK